METDLIATELLAELKESNARKDAHIAQMAKNQIQLVLCFLAVIMGIVAGFLLYLNQYDFKSTEEYTYDYEATGVYALVDSEGNVIAQDFTPEELEKIMEVLSTYGQGESEGNSQKNANQD